MPIPTGVELFFSGTPVSATNEIQRITITGSPAGGTFTILVEGQTTAAIAFNASAAAVQSAIEATSGVDVGEVACSGGPLPGTAVDVTFQNGLGGQNVNVMTANSAGLTGGSTPTVTITTPTPGVRGTYRGAAYGTVCCDTVNGIFYEQTSHSPPTPTWSEPTID